MNLSHVPAHSTHHYQPQPARGGKTGASKALTEAERHKLSVILVSVQHRMGCSVIYDCGFLHRIPLTPLTKAVYLLVVSCLILTGKRLIKYWIAEKYTQVLYFNTEHARENRNDHAH